MTETYWWVDAEEARAAYDEEHDGPLWEPPDNAPTRGEAEEWAAEDREWRRRHGEADRD